MRLLKDMESINLSDINTSVPYPAQTRQAASEISGVMTKVTSISFSDKLMITITQNGRLAQWVTVSLLNENPTSVDIQLLNDLGSEDAMLPAVRFSPRSLLGAGSGQRDMMGHLYASQIASAITTKHPDESRSLVLGLGLAKVETERETFAQIIDLVLQCI